jgi:tetratricopeptide (TPR) repeat protein
VATPARTVPAQLPGDLPAFTGREAELAELDSLLTDPNPVGRGESVEAAAAAGKPQAAGVMIIAIVGPAGVGKTALTVHWAHRVRPGFPDGQLYVDLRGFDPSGGRVEPADAVRGFLEALEVPAGRIPTGFSAQVGLYRSLLAEKRMLVVLDNAIDADQVRPLLPGTAGCLAMITSRTQLAGLVAAEGATSLVLDLLTAAEGRRLLANRLGPARLAAEPAAVETIVDGCAGLPLALAIAAARAASHPDHPLQALADDLDDARHRLDALANGDPATDVRAVFSSTYLALCPDAARLFRLLGLAPGPSISASAAASLAAVPRQRIRPLLAELTRAHLLTETTPGRYGWHDLLRAYAAEQALEHETDADRRAAQHRVLDHHLHTAHAAALLLRPDRGALSLAPPVAGVTCDHLVDPEQALTWFAAEQPVLLAVVEQASSAGFDTHTWQLAWTLADFLDRCGRWHERERTDRAALQSARRLTDPAAEAYSHRRLAVTDAARGRHDEAVSHAQHALDLYTTLGDQAGLAGTHHSLSWTYIQQGRIDQALLHAEQALALSRACGDRVGQATALNNLGWDHALLGNHEQALAACHQALDLFDDLNDRRGQAVAWDSLGYAHHQLGRHQRAITCYHRALTLSREAGDQLNEAATLARLGDVHSDAGERTAAREAWRRALAMLEQLHHPDADAVRIRLRPAPAASPTGEPSWPALGAEAG